MHHTSRTIRRVIVTTVTSAALVTSAMVAPGMGAAAPLAGQDEASKIEPALAANARCRPERVLGPVLLRAPTSLPRRPSLTGTPAVRPCTTHSTRTADASQAAVRAYLDAQGVDYTAFWAVNAIHLDSGTAELARALAAFDGVSGIFASEEVEHIAPVDDPIPAPDRRTRVEWGIANINADDVWAQFGNRGEGIVVSNIDTGVQYNHPALVNQYRGKKAGGGFNHNYNWFNAYGASTAPFDNNGHGTHTMGTMVGDDGGANQIGVAPKAKWIASNGCCGSEAGLVASGQWMLAPTKLNGAKPRRRSVPTS